MVAVAGGEHRSESVANALELCGSELVVVHDAARPLVTPGLIDAVVEELAAEQDAAGGDRGGAGHRHDQARPATAAQVERTLDRSGSGRSQTPQAFRAEALREALADRGRRSPRRPTTRCWSSAAAAAC